MWFDETQSQGGGDTIMNRGVMLVVLFLATVAAHADRYLFTVAAERIRLDLDLDDVQLGLLAGPAMAVFYAVLGIPISRWADVGHRPRLLAACLALWSFFTAACGAATGFWQMFAARLGVGVGEAGAGPPAHSLVASRTEAGRRGAGAAVLTLGTFIGGFVGAAVGGALVSELGWRWTFAAFGGVGLLLAPLVLAGAPENRLAPRAPRAAELLIAGLAADLARLLRRPAVFRFVAGYTLYYVFAHTMTAFGVVFMVRSFGLAEAQVGAPWGLTIASSSIVGTLVAMTAVDRLAVRSPAWLGRIPALLAPVAAAAFVAAFLSPAPSPVYGFLWIGMAAAAIGGPAVFAGVYSQTAEGERGLVVAMMLFFASAIGLGLGPALAGLASEALSPVAGRESVRYTLAVAPVFLLLAGWQFWRASRVLETEPAGPPQVAAT